MKCANCPGEYSLRPHLCFRTTCHKAAGRSIAHGKTQADTEPAAHQSRKSTQKQFARRRAEGAQKWFDTLLEKRLDSPAPVQSRCSRRISKPNRSASPVVGAARSRRSAL